MKVNWIENNGKLHWKKENERENKGKWKVNKRTIKENERKIKENERKTIKGNTGQ